MTTETPPRTRTTAEQLILEQAVLWMARYDVVQAAVAKLGDDVAHDPSPEAHATRAAQLGVVEGWAVIYLLALVRDLDPALAERAARYLKYDAAGLSPRTCERLVQRWQTAAMTGGISTVPLAP